MKRVYWDFGGTIALSTPLEVLLPEILQKEGVLSKVGGTKRVSDLISEYIVKWENIIRVTEHGRPFLYEELVKDLDKAQEVIDRIKDEEPNYYSFTQDNLPEILADLKSITQNMGVITNSSYTSPQRKFFERQGLGQYLPSLYFSSGEWIFNEEVYEEGDKWESRAHSKTGVTKNDGSTYRMLIERQKINIGDPIVGDNPKADGVMARNEGLNPLIYTGGGERDKREIETLAQQHGLILIQRLEQVKGFL